MRLHGLHANIILIIQTKNLWKIKFIFLSFHMIPSLSDENFVQIPFKTLSLFCCNVEMRWEDNI